MSKQPSIKRRLASASLVVTAASMGIVLSAAARSNATPDAPAIAKGELRPSPSALALKAQADRGPGETARTVSQILANDFERPKAGWTASGSWAVGADAAKRSVASTSLDGVYPNAADGALTTPVFKLPKLSDHQRLRLSFAEWYELESSYDLGTVELSADGGKSWTTLSTRSGASGDWLTRSLSLDAWAGRDVQLRFHFSSDASVAYGGWKVDDVAVVLAEDAPLSASMRSINAQNFPYVYADLDIDSETGLCPDPIPASDFAVREDGTSPSELSVIPPATGGGSRLVDVVFVFDNSGSLSDEQAAVEANIEDFVNSLATEGIDYALGLTRYGASQNSGYPILEDAGALTTDASYFINSVLPRNVTTGAFEPGYQAIQDTAEGFAFRPGSQRVLIIITDETAAQGSVGVVDAETALENADATLFAVTYQSLYDDFEPLVDDPTTQLISILDPFDDILPFIVSDISATYRISYRTPDEVITGSSRTVDVDVSCGAEMATASGSYTPGSQPQIALSGETIALNGIPQAQGADIPISVYIEDLVEPFVTNATLFFRTIGSPAYSSVPMTATPAAVAADAAAVEAASGTLFSAVIPGSFADEPGVQYYLTASDGEVTSSLPSVSPASAPYEIAVLPNEAPSLSHVPVTEAPVGIDIPIAANASDMTNALTSITLFYRTTGTLTYVAVPMSPVGGDAFSAVIPGAAMTSAGAQYYIEAVDDFGVSAFAGFADEPNVIAALSVEDPGCDLDGSGSFDTADVKVFKSGCKAGTASFECDIDGDGDFDGNDTRAFVRGCKSGN